MAVFIGTGLDTGLRRAVCAPAQAEQSPGPRTVVFAEGFEITDRAGRILRGVVTITIAFIPAGAVGAFPEADYTQVTGPSIVDAIPFFSGGSLSFRFTGDGVAVDPDTGLVSFGPAALFAGVSVLATAVHACGRTELDLNVKLIPTAPAALTAPALSGSGRIGAPLTVDPGVWIGDPAPETTLEWLRDGAALAGAVAAEFTPGAPEDGKTVACRVTARNASGTTVLETPGIAVAYAPPLAAGALADLVLALGPGAVSVPAAQAFTGAALAFSAAGGGVGIDPATGVLSVPLDTPRAGETVTVTASNSGGAAQVRFALAVMAAPAAAPAPAPAVFDQGAGVGTLSAQAFFAGDDLVYALEAAPAGVTLNAGSGLVTVPIGAPLTGTVGVRASNALGSAAVSFPVTVRATVTRFDAPEALGQVTYLHTAAAPVWRHDAAGGFAVLTPNGPNDRAHGAWPLARGDGRYRALVRPALAGTAPTAARPFGIAGRMAREGLNWRGLRVDLVLRLTGAAALEIRQYSGLGEAAAVLSGALVAWNWNAWIWLEAEFDGAAVRGRIYPEGGPVPAWQARAAATHLAPGFHGPASHTVSNAFLPEVHIKQLEYYAPPAAAPALPADADWSLAQVMVQQ